MKLVAMITLVLLERIVGETNKDGIKDAILTSCTDFELRLSAVRSRDHDKQAQPPLLLNGHAGSACRLWS